MDCTHLLNDIFASNYYTIISSAVTPCGLIALLMAAPTMPGREEFILNRLEKYAFRFHEDDDIQGLVMFCDGIAAELDANVQRVFINAGTSTPPYFKRWWSQTQICLMASKDSNDDEQLQKLSIESAESHRLYDGFTTLQRSAVIDLGPLS